jgi:hypothetical protein
MSGSGEAAAFKTLQTDFLAFIASNILIVSTVKGAAYGRTGLREYAFGTSSATAIFADTKKPCPVYYLASVDKWTTTPLRFTAYYCEYNENDTNMLVIDDAADLMFTPTMNGCSFAIGSPTNTGARLVAHANVTRRTDVTDVVGQQDKDQKAVLRNVGAFRKDEGGQIFGPKKYLEEGQQIQATTYGYRVGQDWHFASQVRRGVGAQKYEFVKIVNII